LFTCLLVYLFTCLLVYLFVYLFTCLLVYLFTCLLVYLFTCLLVYLFIYNLKSDEVGTVICFLSLFLNLLEKVVYISCTQLSLNLFNIIPEYLKFIK